MVTQIEAESAADPALSSISVAATGAIIFYHFEKNKNAKRLERFSNSRRITLPPLLLYKFSPFVELHQAEEGREGSTAN